MNERRVLVTGATGFIGRHCLAGLQARGYEIHATTSSAVPAQNGVHWHQLDLLDHARTTTLLAKLQPDSLLHLAWYAKHGLFWQAFENVDWVRASLSLLRAFIAHGGRRMVCAGSCAEYDWSNGICSEDTTPLRPQGLYGVAKNALHSIAAAAARRSAISFAWGRIFYLYGEGEQDARLVPLIINAQLRGERITLTGGSLQRDYLHVADVAAALVALLDSRVEGAVNIGSEHAVTIRAIADRLTARLGRPELVEFAARDGNGTEIPLVVADTKRLTGELHWKPAIGLDHVAVERDRALAELREVEHRAQRAADQALDFLGAARLLAARRFTVGAGMGRARQHAVLRRHPALARALQPARHPLGERGRAQHSGAAEAHQDRPLGLVQTAALEAHGSQLVIGPAIGAGHGR